jgi:hypothetical protein
MKISRYQKVFPFVIAGICLLAFGLLIPFLGFYQDDWHPVYYGYSRGLDSLWELFLYDNRPFAAVIYIFGFKILGYKPIAWQVLALTLRILTVLAIWMVFVELWPENKRQASWGALLFGVYPFFDLQPLALIYTIQWIGFLLFSISIWAMLRSIQKPQHYRFYTILSLVTSALQLLIIEYYIGLELIRPLLIWMSIRDREISRKETFNQVVKLWVPYLGILVLYIIFRLFFIPRPPSGFERNAPWLLYNFVDNPFNTITHFVESASKDIVIILGAPWNNLFSPDIIGVTTPSNLFAITLAIMVAGGLYFFFRKYQTDVRQTTASSIKWTKSALILGLVFVLLGPIPGWLTNQFISTKNPLWSSRFGLASMIGASILIVALLELLISNQKYRTVIYCCLIGLSVSWHFLNANDFRWAWQTQTNFYNQLKLRAPYIKPNTAIFSDSELFPRMGEYPTTFALNSLYSRQDDSRDLDYWFFGLYRGFNEERQDLVEGIELTDAQFSSKFSSNSLDSLVLYYEPELNQCLWVVSPEYGHVYELPEISREVSGISNLDRIVDDPPESLNRSEELFGKLEADNWCYYFQKADLGKQNKDWADVVNQWNEAAKNEYKPGNGVEYLPFIEGFAMTGDWDKAELLTRRANRVTLKMKPILCTIWNRIDEEAKPSIEKDESVRQVFNKLNCQ